MENRSKAAASRRRFPSSVRSQCARHPTSLSTCGASSSVPAQLRFITVDGYTAGRSWSDRESDCSSDGRMSFRSPVFNSRRSCLRWLRSSRSRRRMWRCRRASCRSASVGAAIARIPGRRRPPPTQPRTPKRDRRRARQRSRIFSSGARPSRRAELSLCSVSVLRSSREIVIFCCFWCVSAGWPRLLLGAHAQNRNSLQLSGARAANRRFR